MSETEGAKNPAQEEDASSSIPESNDGLQPGSSSAAAASDANPNPKKGRGRPPKKTPGAIAVASSSPPPSGAASPNSKRQTTLFAFSSPTKVVGQLSSSPSASSDPLPVAEAPASSSSSSSTGRSVPPKPAAAAASRAEANKRKRESMATPPTPAAKPAASKPTPAANKRSVSKPKIKKEIVDSEDDGDDEPVLSSLWDAPIAAPTPKPKKQSKLPTAAASAAAVTPLPAPKAVITSSGRASKQRNIIIDSSSSEPEEETESSDDASMDTEDDEGASKKKQKGGRAGKPEAKGKAAAAVASKKSTTPAKKVKAKDAAFRTWKKKEDDDDEYKGSDDDKKQSESSASADESEASEEESSEEEVSLDEEEDEEEASDSDGRRSKSKRSSSGGGSRRGGGAGGGGGGAQKGSTAPKYGSAASSAISKYNDPNQSAIQFVVAMTSSTTRAPPAPAAKGKPSRATAAVPRPAPLSRNPLVMNVESGRKSPTYFPGLRPHILSAEPFDSSRYSARLNTHIALDAMEEPVESAEPRIMLSPFEGAAPNPRISFFNTGGSRVTAISWCPVPPSSPVQYAALSAHPSHEPDHFISSKHTGLNLIQIWEFSVVAVTPPRLVLAIEHDRGFCFDLRWLPSVCTESYPDVEPHQLGHRLGLLAAVFGNGSLGVYSVPQPQPSSSSDAPLAATTTVRLKPILDVSLPMSTVTIACCEWVSQVDHVTIVTGHSDGSAALWDVDLAAERSMSSAAALEQQMMFSPPGYEQSPIWITELHSNGPIRDLKVFDLQPYFVITIGDDGYYRIIDIRDPLKLLSVHVLVRTCLPEVAIPPSLSSFLVATHEAGIRQLEVREELLSELVHSRFPFQSLSIHSGSAIMAVGDCGGFVNLLRGLNADFFIPRRSMVLQEFDSHPLRMERVTPTQGPHPQAHAYEVRLSGDSVEELGLHPLPEDEDLSLFYGTKKVHSNPGRAKKANNSRDGMTLAAGNAVAGGKKKFMDPLVTWPRVRYCPSPNMPNALLCGSSVGLVVLLDASPIPANGPEGPQPKAARGRGNRLGVRKPKKGAVKEEEEEAEDGMDES